MKKIVLALILLTLAASSCSMFAKAPQNVVKGKDTVCILVDESGFKRVVIEKLTDELKTAGYTVAVDDIKHRKFYAAKDFAAVVYMTEYWAWHVPIHAKRYYRKNGRAPNIVFVITSGDPDLTITKPFDAVTGASTKANVERFTNEIMAKLKPVL